MGNRSQKQQKRSSRKAFHFERGQVSAPSKASSESISSESANGFINEPEISGSSDRIVSRGKGASSDSARKSNQKDNAISKEEAALTAQAALKALEALETLPPLEELEIVGFPFVAEENLPEAGVESYSNSSDIAKKGQSQPKDLEPRETEKQIEKQTDGLHTSDTSGQIIKTGAVSGNDLDNLSEEEFVVPSASQGERSRIRTWHVVSIFVLLLMIACIVLASLFVWDRWYRFDDQKDMEGTWYVQGTNVPIQITQDTIQFTPTTSYAYTIDQSIKSIYYSLGNLDGEGHYWFAEDRQVLVVTDGEGFTRDSTAAEDLFRLFTDFANMSSGARSQLPQGEGVIVLTRAPNSYGQGKAQDSKSTGQAADKSADSSSQDASSKAAEKGATGSSTAEKSSSDTNNAGSLSDSSSASSSSENGKENQTSSNGVDSPRDVFDVVGDIVQDQ